MKPLWKRLAIGIVVVFNLLVIAGIVLSLVAADDRCAVTGFEPLPQGCTRYGTSPSLARAFAGFLVLVLAAVDGVVIVATVLLRERRRKLAISVTEANNEEAEAG